MTQDEALDLIRKAANEVTEGAGDPLTTDTHLLEDEVFDSLDLMNFMFELEELYGQKIEEVTEDFTDFRVAALIGFMTKA